ncbi:TonB-dependent receptor [Sphingosinicella soli]|uniref:Iron complex outermembrane receptor protein n=1 Tax=Sphingosinicella soli TaxID=333708 RepID=A0A7W7B4N0_9SPHN|nr:TonB-dependent receptor [Sphingosinicella soli]MBB4633865.1 iron complex outermembrane receptor protein [Sphingosinicella soli]
MSARHGMGGVGLVALAFAIHGNALAQTQGAPAPVAGQAAMDAQADDGGLAEIIVTATRRNTNLQTTPVAVSAVDSAMINQAAPRDISDLSTFVPNFSAAKITGFNAASFALRGVSVNNIIVYYEAPVGVLVDDFVMPSVQTQLLDTFDIDQFEVLRGPQGTLFGKNTTGGAVTVRTKRPDLTQFGGEARLSYGSFDTYQVQGALNVPIMTDTLGLRLVGAYNKSAGFMRNGYCYGPVTPFGESKYAGASGCGDGRRIGGSSVFSGRAKLLWEPSADISALLQYEIIRDDSDPAAAIEDTPAGPGFLFNLLGVGGAANTGDPLKRHGLTFRESEYIEMSKARVDVDGVFLNVNIDVGVGTITNVAGYRFQRSRLPNSTTGMGSIVADDGDELALFDLNRSDDRKTWQEELRFASDLGGPFDFVAGAFYQRETVDFCVAQVLGFQDLVGATTPYGAWDDNPYVLCNDQRSRSTALYAEGTYEITDALTLTVGGRYTWEKKRWRGRQQAFVQDITGDPTMTWEDIPLMDLNDFSRFPDGVVTNRATFKEPTWRASLGYRFTPDTFGYATYSRGFKGGGFNDQIGSFAPFGENLDAFRAAAEPTTPETADSFEAGVKTELFDRRLRFNLTGFYVKYKNLQKQIVTPLVVNGQTFQVTRFFNAAAAEVKGLEAELTAIPVDGLTLRANLGYQDGKYNEYVTPLPAGYDLASAPLDRAPKWQWAADATYALPVGDAGNLFLNGNVAFTDRNLFSQSITSPDENAYLGARTIFNGSIGFRGLDDAYSVRLVGRNLTDKRYKVSQLVVGGLWTFSNYAPPRSWMLEVSTKF